jgi:hypothetical protein
MAFSKDSTFTIHNVTGETSGETFSGAFRVLLVLSHAQQLERDRIRRELLGGQAQAAADERAANQARIFSDLAVRIASAPRFWTESNNGLELVDDSVVKAVYDQTTKLVADHMAEVEKRAEVARKQLEAAQPSAPSPT